MARLFVKVYYEDLQRDYPEVWADDAAVSTWLRLLVIQDKMFPTPPALPRACRPRTLALLTKTGLVTLVPQDSYRVKGYQSERLARQDAARNAAAVRWHSKGNAEGNADAYAEIMPTRARTEVRVQSTEVSKENGEKRARGGTLEKVSDVLPRALR